MPLCHFFRLDRIPRAPDEFPLYGLALRVAAVRPPFAAGIASVLQFNKAEFAVIGHILFHKVVEFVE